MKSLKYKESIDYLLNQLPMFQRVGAAAYRADLGNITALCDLLDNPQNNLTCIHVAGTNGKGSVTHIMASILQAQGYKVGVYTSPHYKDYRERIKINGKLISKKFVSHFVEKYKDQFQHLNASFFEITNAMAFYYFNAQKVDFAIIETGMGGRLDSTNIITPLISIITNISLDHQQFLGDTLEKIAAEKAGIIKQKVPVIIGEVLPETKPVFEKIAKEKKAAIYFAEKEILFDAFSAKKTGIEVKFGKEKLNSDLSGKFQQKNLKTAFCAFQVLAKFGILISPKAFKFGLKNICQQTYFIGRWTKINSTPLTYIDSAHNEAGIRELIHQIQQLKFRELHFVYGTVADKNLTNILKLLPTRAHYYLCKPDIPRGKPVAELANEFSQVELKNQSFPSVKKAWKAATNNAKRNDLIIVSGSIFVVAEVL